MTKSHGYLKHKQFLNPKYLNMAIWVSKHTQNTVQVHVVKTIIALHSNEGLSNIGCLNFIQCFFHKVYFLLVSVEII